jgi:twitching motility protein PilI
MANKEALRELQSRLAERLKLARTQERGKSWLAVESAGRGFLLPLKDAGEIFSFVGVLPVPHSLPWFLGVANLRGHLHGVVDLARFLGLDPVGKHLGEAGRETARLVAFNAGLDINCALLVEKLAGLRNASQLRPKTTRRIHATAFCWPAFSGFGWTSVARVESFRVVGKRSVFENRRLIFHLACCLFHVARDLTRDI